MPRRVSINFETIEPKLVFDEDGKVKDIVVKDRGISERIIEEFMLVANETVAGHFKKPACRDCSASTRT
ncbi:MAG: RNB domain-containing ribonuclease [Bacillus subtilis]|nr:RNB domain-containing ribonuclease [Bacillus subtilis]